VFAQLVDGAYFKTLLIPLRSGRAFEAHDPQFDWERTNQQVAIVNEKMAHEFWRTENAVGKVVVLESKPNALVECRIVGVSGDVRQSELDREGGPEIYLLGRGRGELVIRTAVPLSAMASQIREVLHQFDSKMAVTEFRPLNQILNDAVAPKRLMISCLGAFSVVALGLAAIGVFGVTAYSTSQRTKEMGIRIALGATHGAVVRLITREGCRRVWIGCFIGLGVTSMVVHALRSFLFEVSPIDPVTLMSTTLILVAIGFAASWLPARKASQIDPIIALRQE
jgi:hypothetical protein